MFYSSWASVNAGVPQGSILGPLFFLIFINGLSSNLILNPKLFADDTSLFSVVQDITLSAKNLNDDLKKINKWAFQWKMSFNPDPNKQAQEVIFSRKLNKPNHPSLNFNNTVVIQSTNHKHLGMILDTKLDFLRHLKDKLTKISKTIGLLRKLQKILNRAPLLTIYKSCIRPHLDYGDIIYVKAYNNSFHQNLEKIQYNSALAITGAIRGTSKEKLYQELGLESLEKRRWYRKLCYFYKIFNKQSPTYLLNIIPASCRSYLARYVENVPSFKVRHDFFKNSFFPSTVIEWNKIDKNIRKSESFAIFKKSILKSIRSSQSRVYNCHNPKRIKLLTRLRVGLSHLCEHQFKHSFQDTLNPICHCGEDIETISHYLLHCTDYLHERRTLRNTVSCILPNIFGFNNDQLTEILLYGKEDLHNINNTSILDATINYLI